MPSLPDRMTYLRNAEAFTSVVLPALLCYDWQRSGASIAWEMRGAALLLVSFILLQGVWYWQLKLSSVVRRQPLPIYFFALYRFFKYSNVLLIAALAVFIVTRNSETTSLTDRAWSSSLLAFAVLEHINYYHYQLMYDTRAAFAYLRRNGRLRKAALGLDLGRRKPV